MDSKTVYLSPDQLQEQGLPPLTLCGGPVAAYQASTPSGLWPIRSEPVQQLSVGVRPLAEAPRKFSPKLVQMLLDLTPAQRDEAAKIAGKLLAIRARKVKAQSPGK